MEGRNAGGAAPRTGLARFEGRVAIVTGGSSGIGLATAIRLGHEGARVVIVNRHPEEGEAAARIVRECGAPDAFALACDVSEEDQVASAVADTVDRFGRVDVVVNNAGVMVFKPLTELTKDDWIRVLGVDLLGAFYFLKHALPRMEKGGAFVNVSSVHAVETTPLVATYAASKAALLSLTRSAAIEARSRGVRVNAIVPGAVDTPMLRENPNIKSGAEKLDPAHVGKPEDLAAAIAFLASSDANFITGAALNVDGGRLAQL